MHLRKEFRIAFGLIFGLQLATAFGAIAVLDRMGPAIAQVAADNVESLGAIEQMLGALALESGPMPEAAAAELRQAYAKAAANVTEEEEKPLLDSIQTNLEAAISGEQQARFSVVTALRRLSSVNRQAMFRSDNEAQRLARAGAWAAALLAFLTFLVARLLAARVENRLITPLFDIYSTLQAAKNGDTRRRSTLFKGSAEIEGIALGVNSLLDAR
ncbi:MAG: hypothetical protein H6509_00015 [Bryobacterales bacterium]|nr:hypothetical protein [Bryobacterales bacterium]